MAKLTEPPKGHTPGSFPGSNGFWYRLRHDDEGKDKLEDRWPVNTFVELYLFIIAVVLGGIFVALLGLLQLLQ